MKKSDVKLLIPKNYDLRRRNFKPNTVIVLDHTVLINDPMAFTKFPKCFVHIFEPTVLRLAQYKEDLSERGRLARKAIRYLDSLRAEGDLKTGVPTSQRGGKLFVVSVPKASADPYSVLIYTQKLQKKYAGRPVVLLTTDAAMRISAAIHGLDAYVYPISFTRSLLTQKADHNISGSVLQASISKENLKVLLRERKVPFEALDLPPIASKLSANQFIQLTLPDKKESAHFAKYLVDTDEVGIALGITDLSQKKIFGIQARNIQQLCALDYLLDKDIEIVIVSGKAGTGKSLLSFAAALEQSYKHKYYQKVSVIYRNYRVGLSEDVLKLLIRSPIVDFVECMLVEDPDLKSQMKIHEAEPFVDKLFNERRLVVEYLEFLRGRTFQNRFVVIDEAQNLTPAEVRLILTRAGKSTKFVFCGDPSQADNIDNPEVNEEHNGLKYLIESCKYDQHVAHIDLKVCERSPLADRVTKTLW